MKARDLKKLVFDKLVKNLTQIVGFDVNYILCPICTRDFHKLDNLTFGHIIPESLGGRRRTLVCTECDNRLGHQAESHLKNFLLAEEGSLGLSFLQGSLEISGVRINQATKWDVKKGGTTEFSVGKNNDPKKIELFQEKLRNNPDKIELKLRLNYNPIRVKIAHIKIGYLACFDEIGYRYVLSENTKLIREQLLHPSRHNKDLELLSLTNNNCDHDFKGRYSIKPISIPNSGISTPMYLVSYALKNQINKIYSVAMPPLAISFEDYIERLRNIRKIDKTFQISILESNLK